MRVLALDVATRTGWCVLSDASGAWEIDGIGVWDVTPEKGEPMGVRFHSFRIDLCNTLALYGPIDAVAIEDNHSRSFYAAKLQGGFLAVALLELEARGIDYALPTVGEWKKHLTGKGNTKKPGVRRALNGRLGLNPGSPLTEDEADAVGIGLWLIETSLSPSRDEVSDGGGLATRGGDDSEEAA